MTTATTTPPIVNAAIQSSVGVFWRVEKVLVTDVIALPAAEPYGDFLTSRGHSEVWDEWTRFGVTGLRKRGMPAEISWSEYEQYPRGRVVFDKVKELFIVYADRRLQGSATVDKIVAAFGISDQKYVVRSDSHYR